MIYWKMQLRNQSCFKNKRFNKTILQKVIVSSGDKPKTKNFCKYYQKR